MMIISHTPLLSKTHDLVGNIKEDLYELIHCKEKELMFILNKKQNDLVVLNLEINDEPQTQLFSVSQEGELSAAETNQPTVDFTLSNNITFEAASGSTVLEIIPKMISPHFRRLIQHDTIEAAIGGYLKQSERPTAYIYGTLKDAQAYMIIGTNEGNLILMRLFILNGHDITIYLAKVFDRAVKSIELFDGNMYCSDSAMEVISVDFDASADHRETKNIELNKNRSIVVRQMSDTQIKRIDLPNKLKCILPIIFIGEETQHQEEVLHFCKTLIGLYLENNQIVLLEQKGLISVFEYQFSDNVPVGLYFDRKSEFLNILYDKGDIDVFNVNFGNIMMMIKFRQSVADKHSASSVLPPEIEYQLKVFSSYCFAYERSTTVGTHYLNLLDMLRDYKNTFVDLHSFSTFTSNPLINVTQNGSVFEFATQFYTNELLSTHIEYQKLKKGAVKQRPIILVHEEKKKEIKKKQPTMEEAFQGITSLKDLNALLEQQNKEEKVPEEKSETILIENIPLKLQNVLERNNFMLIRERLEEKPLKLLDYYEAKGVFVDPESQFSSNDVLKMLSYMNYANFDIFADPQVKEDCVILKKTWNNRQFYIMDYYPPVYEIGNDRHNMLMSTVLFPSGVDVQSELEFKAAFGDGFPAIEFAIGTQGVAETFSFILNEHFLHINNHLESSIGSPVTPVRGFKEVSYFTVSSYVTTSILLGVVSELIYILKKGYLKVGPLISAIRTIFFEKMVLDIPDFKPVSQKILTMLTLNDKLLVSASSHFILNNIYDKYKISQALKPVLEVIPDFVDTKSMGTLSFYWLQVKNAKGYRESEPLSILNTISKFELYVISMLLYHIKLGAIENSSVPISRECVINLIHPILE